MFFVLGYTGHLEVTYWSLTLVRQSGGIELTHIVMVAICNLHIEYGHCTKKQMYENVLNNLMCGFKQCC